MKNIWFKLGLVAVFYLLDSGISAQTLVLDKAWKFQTGDDAAWVKPEFKDKQWKTINPSINWEQQGYDNYDGFAWYRVRFTLPSTLKSESKMQKELLFYMGRIDDVDECYLNGIKIGGEGRLPESPGGYDTQWRKERKYVLPINHPAIKWDAENVLAIRVFDGNGGGGMFSAMPYVKVLDLIDYISMDVDSDAFWMEGSVVNKMVRFNNHADQTVKGELKVTIQDMMGKTREVKRMVEIPASGTENLELNLMSGEGIQLLYTFTEERTGVGLNARQEMPYILTPAVGAEPRINTPSVYGCRPNAPFLFRIPATGKGALRYEVLNLPQGLLLNAEKGIITGTVPAAGEYFIEIKVSNAVGSDQKSLKIVSGDKICLTPPLGWNSWNCWGLTVNDTRVRNTAEAMALSGLAGHGWTYINIDDGWEAPTRDTMGNIVCNEKFPDMKGLGDYLHGFGLKFGIYSSPGTLTCGGFLGSYQHEQQDADTYASWGVDYLKYDWCSYGAIAPEKPSLADYQHPYMVMDTALRNTGRDIVYSLCQYGMGDVWTWGGKVGGNLWRTTGDIEDTWESLSSIGFAQAKPAAFNRAGYGWGDPDMLIVGKLGWGDQLHFSRLAPSEQYTHITLWAMLNAPLLLGCDLTQLDAFTYNLISNDEVIAVDQDVSYPAATKVLDTEGYQVWVKRLSDGSHAIAIVNMKNEAQMVRFKWADLKLNDPNNLMDLWRQEPLEIMGSNAAVHLPAHGCALWKLW